MHRSNLRGVGCHGSLMLPVLMSISLYIPLILGHLVWRPLWALTYTQKKTTGAKPIYALLL